VQEENRKLEKKRPKNSVGNRGCYSVGGDRASKRDGFSIIG
jgi:hypothetical protein